MRGKIVQVTWQAADDEAALKALYQNERDALVKPRLHLSWLVRQGQQLQQAAQVIGVHPRTAQQWIAWYREGGVALVSARKRGGYGQPSRLSLEQKQALISKAREEGFVSVKDAVRFVAEQFAVSYTESGMTKVFASLSLRKKRPRPRNAKATQEAQDAFKKGD